MTMNEQDTSSLHASKLTVIHYEPDPFLPMTNTKGAFAVLGVAAAVSEGSEEEVAALTSHDGIILDVRTFGWGTMYYPFKTKYKVNYMAQARLINAREKRLISAERCSINEQYSENSPTYDELMENGAALLKKKLADASAECAARFAEKMGVNRSVALKQ